MTDRLPMPAVTRHETSVSGEVITIDHFGNAVTNIRQDDIGDLSVVHLATGPSIRVNRTYADVSEGAVLALIGSSGHLEIAVRNGSAAEHLGLEIGSTVKVLPSRKDR